MRRESALNPPGYAGRPAADGATRRIVTWWLVVVGTGVAAGAAGIALTLLLHAVQHVAFGYTENTFRYGVIRASPARRVLVLITGGVVAGLGWWLVRSITSVRTVADAVSPAVSPAASRLPVVSTTVDSCLQIVVVGLGASLGREGAPRQLAASCAAWLAERCGLDAEQRRIVIAAGAGAGLAAVYNVPLSGCLFAAEVVLRSLSLRCVVPAAVASVVATVTSWLVLPDQPTYSVGPLHLTGSLLTWSVLAGPIAGLAGWAFRELMRRARSTAPRSWRLPVATVTAFAALGALAIPFPDLLGNGKGPTQLALTGSLGLAAASALVFLKPAATAACLRSGATGGLLTPSLATGALLGAVLGHAWSLLWPGTQPGAYAVVAAAAMLAVTQRAPLTAVVLVVEFTGTGVELLVPMLIAIGLAMAVAELLPAPGRT
ncbi:MAG TPA: chloride channel protein, partial [Pseudonocardiaceae bacterium]|nr:chloride channel protein [Pseudonocardiaceae bacterium]